MIDPKNVPAEVLGFLVERHLATLTTLRDRTELEAVHFVPLKSGIA